MKKPILALVGGIVLSGAAGTNAAHAANPTEIARQSVGEAYRWGANDCSGFTKKVFAQLGIQLPHHSASQAHYGTPVKKSDLKPGDLVFFNTSGKGISHVGIYAGGGWMISSENEQTGVRETQIFGGGASDYWESRYVTARRLTGAEETVPEAKGKVVKKKQTKETTVNQTKKPMNHHVLYRHKGSMDGEKVEKKTKTFEKKLYTVKAGDSLWAISKNHGLDVVRIQSMNRMDSITIYPGQKLYIEEQENRYTIKAGDTLWKIAAGSEITVRDLMEKNGLESSLIYPGQNLNIS